MTALNNHNAGNNGDGAVGEPSENIILPEHVDTFSNTNNVDSDLFQQLAIKAEDFRLDGASDGSSGEYKKSPSRYEHPLWNLGWTDGRLGQPRETNEALLLAHGRLRRDKRVQQMEQKASLNKALLENIQERVKGLRERLAEATIRYQNILKERAGRYHEFSYSLAAFYLVIATILFLSDVPLTLKLVAKGFNLKTEVRDPNSHQVLYGVDELLVRTSDVIIQLWQPLTLALGIALAGVFIKLFLDDVVFRSHSDRPKKITRTLSLIMVFLFLTIMGLGMFRARIQTQLNDEEIQATAATIRKRLEGTPEAEINKIINRLPQNQEGWLTVTTFIALTLTLPLIAGACFSAGWRRLKDTQLYRQTKREVGKLERDLRKQSEQLVSATAEITSAVGWLERNAGEHELVDSETEQELSLYRHGYLRGVSLPETIDHGLSLHSRVQKSAEKIIAGRLRSRIWSDINQRMKA